MLRGIYTAASGMMAAMIGTDTLANNLANVNTAGFKRNAVNYQTFPEMMLNRLDGDGASSIGSVMTGTKVRSTAVNFDQGQLHQTGNPLDIAIDGEGFFTVKDDKDQIFYTRNGAFTISPDGYLVNQQGYHVQGERGDIVVPPGSSSLQINQQGDVSEKEGVIDRLLIANFEDNNTLEKVGDNAYKTTDASKKLPTPFNKDEFKYRLRQYSIENANVNPVSELVNSITGMRLYEALQKNIHLHNQMLEKAVNDVGRYRA